MAQRCFFDTNVVVYCLDQRDPVKHVSAKNLVAMGLGEGLGIVSYQVLQEFCNVVASSKAIQLSHPQAIAFLRQVLQPMCKVEPSADLLEQALAVRAATAYGFYDSLIVASAQAAGCELLYTEDMQHQRKIQNLTIVNPFVA